jgi:hypothetical protein
METLRCDILLGGMSVEDHSEEMAPISVIIFRDPF